MKKKLIITGVYRIINIDFYGIEDYHLNLFAHGRWISEEIFFERNLKDIVNECKKVYCKIFNTTDKDLEVILQLTELNKLFVQ